MIACDDPTLLGKNWLTKIRFNWNKLVHKVEVEDSALDVILRRLPGVLKELGLVKGYSAKIHVDSNTPPIFYKARPVAYALREKVDAELDRLQRQGIIELVEFSQWATPIVPVVKSNGATVYTYLL